MTCSVMRLNPAFLDREWPKVAEFLTNGLMSCEGEITVDQLRMLCAKGMAEVYVALKDDKVIGAAAVEAIIYPNFRAANVISAGGRGIYNKDFWPLFMNWLRDQGYSKVQGYCPPAVARLLRKIEGFRTAYELVRADL